MAFTRGIEHARALYVANADGTGAAVIRGRGGTPFRPISSPDGTHIAFLVLTTDALNYSIVVVDVPSGSYREPIPGLVHDGWPVFSWSAAGSRILIPVPDDRGRPSLWGVNGRRRRSEAAG